MLTGNELKERIQSVLDHKLSIEEFEDWLVPNSWNIHLWAPRFLQDLVFGVELRLAELEKGHFGEDEFRSELESLLQEIIGIAGYSVDVRFNEYSMVVFHGSIPPHHSNVWTSSYSQDATVISKSTIGPCKKPNVAQLSLSVA